MKLDDLLGKKPDPPKKAKSKTAPFTEKEIQALDKSSDPADVEVTTELNGAFESLKGKAGKAGPNVVPMVYMPPVPPAAAEEADPKFVAFLDALDAALELFPEGADNFRIEIEMFRDRFRARFVSRVPPPLEFAVRGKPVTKFLVDQYEDKYTVATLAQMRPYE